MRETKAIFVNEKAKRLLNYFISYKEIINKTENNNSNNPINNDIVVEMLPEPEHIALK